MVATESPTLLVTNRTHRGLSYQEPRDFFNPDVFGTLVEEAASEMTLTRIESVGATPRRRGDSEAPSERVEIRKATLVTLP